jgi:hypothetical protein
MKNIISILTVVFPVAVHSAGIDRTCEPQKQMIEEQGVDLNALSAALRDHSNYKFRTNIPTRYSVLVKVDSDKKGWLQVVDLETGLVTQFPVATGSLQGAKDALVLGTPKPNRKTGESATRYNRRLNSWRQQKAREDRELKRTEGETVFGTRHLLLGSKASDTKIPAVARRPDTQKALKGKSQSLVACAGDQLPGFGTSGDICLRTQDFERVSKMLQADHEKSKGIEGQTDFHVDQFMFIYPSSKTEKYLKEKVVPNLDNKFRFCDYLKRIPVPKVEGGSATGTGNREGG